MSNLSDSEIAYRTAFDSFQLCVGYENGDVFHLPYSGGVLEQPHKTIKMWQIFRSELTDHIAKENKKKAQKAKSRR